FDRKLTDIFSVETDVAKAIANQLQAKLSPSEKAAIERAPTAGVRASDIYSRAKTLMFSTTFDTPQNKLQALDLLNQAVVRDPSFFQAYCLLANMHDQLSFFGLDHTSARSA